MNSASPSDERSAGPSAAPAGAASPAAPAAHAPPGAADAAVSPEKLARLLTGTPREILARIVPGDPLRVRPRVAERVRARWVLVDTDRVHLRALALAARQADRWRGRPALETWLGARVELAIDEILEEEPGEASPAELPQPGVFEVLASPLGLDPPRLRRLCATFNRLPDPVRRSFFLLVLEGRGVDEVARLESGNATEIARRARRALDAFLAGLPPDLPPSD